MNEGIDVEFDGWESDLDGFEDLLATNRTYKATKPPRTGSSTHQEDVPPVDVERINFINEAFRNTLVERQRQRIEAVEKRIHEALERLRVQGRASREQVCPGCKQPFTAYKKRSGNRWPTYCHFCAHRTDKHQVRRNHAVPT